MRLSTAAIGGLLCLVTVGCAPSLEYIPLHAIDRTSPPSKIEVLSDFPDNEYVELGAMRIGVPCDRPNIEPTNGQLEALKREAGKYGADAVVVLPCRTDRFARTEKGLKIPNTYFLDVFAISWPGPAEDTTSNPIREEQATVGLPQRGDTVAVEEPPVGLYYGCLNYPARSGMSGIRGSLWITELIDTRGRPQEVKVLQSSGVDAGFEEAAMEAAKRNRFRPAKHAGKPIPVWVSYKVDFGIQH